MSLATLTNDELVSRTSALVGTHRELTAALVSHLAEIEERRLHLIAGYSSMFDFCQRKLGMSEGEAFRRIVAARLVRRFPLVQSLLGRGDVTLSTLELVRERLTDENHVELLAEVSRKTKREVESVLAARFPKPDVRSRIRPASRLEPLADARFRVEFTASRVLSDKLERALDLMSHANPGRDLGVVVERAVDLLLRELERTRFAALKRPRATRSTSDEIPVSELAPLSSRISNATRRRVFQRDGARCTYVADDGCRCDARAFLELDHVHPKALGGTNDADNLRVRCRAHNRLWAEQVFGRASVENHFRRQKSRVTEKTSETCTTRSGKEAHGVLEKAHRALRALGFRDADARRAVAEVAKHHLSDEAFALDQAVREALLVATSKAA